jgi:hypothetical protein
MYFPGHRCRCRALQQRSIRDWIEKCHPHFIAAGPEPEKHTFAGPSACHSSPSEDLPLQLRLSV